ncbi:hypothetical protein GO685_04255 [Wolbachia endosymbiont of Madathamugadia hiepei]|uniref:hypothetical protein n=1 Tax=Wolbachia endosymbiont of Madathamugadia hiepei TaxID=1241303 RepID=UPI00158BC65E|nr:hypothetical protein [Wolbachia endosymbiont of Madathamugadia hiepei]NUX01680.1 hypothetical protein [Wolbachia endosymbiont of Madathamugadia hiepei]
MQVADTGIQKFYQVGEHKNCVKMHHFYGKLDPSIKYWDDKKGSAGMTRNGATWVTRNGGVEMTGRGYLYNTFR